MTGTETYYPSLRDALDDRFAALSDAEIDEAFGAAFGEGVSAAEYEEFFSSLGKALKKAAPTLAAFGKGALSGAAAGSALGPFGALGGALIGGTGGALAKSGRGPLRDIGRVAGGVVGTAGQLLPGGAAANVFQTILQRPETAKALSAVLSGRNVAVPLGSSGISVPANAFAGLLGSLARESVDSEPEWADNEEVTDPDIGQEQLLQLLAAIPPESDESDEFEADYDDAYDDADALDSDESFESDEFWMERV
ncbi:hypothetical protein [Mycobacterium sp. MMS18-G62]